MKISPLLLVAISLISAAPALAQDEDQQIWFQVNGAIKLGDSSRLTLEGISRFANDNKGIYTESGVLYTRKLDNGIELSLGYRHVEDWPRNGRPSNDERLRQMIQVPFGSGFAGRLRFEQRFNRNGPEVGVRLRPRFNYETALPNTKLRLYAAQEHYFNFNTTAWGQVAGYERIRNSAGLAIPIDKSARAEIGYLNQVRFGRNGGRDRMEHALTMTLNLNIASIGDGD